MAAVTVKTLYSFYHMILDSCNLNSQSKSDVNQKSIAVIFLRLALTTCHATEVFHIKSTSTTS